MTGGIYFAGEYLAEGVCARRGCAHEQSTLDFGMVGVMAGVVQETELHGTVRVEQQYNVIEVAAHIVQKVCLILVELQIVVVRAARAGRRSVAVPVVEAAPCLAAGIVRHARGKVCTLAAYARYHDERRVVIVGKVRAFGVEIECRYGGLVSLVAGNVVTVAGRVGTAGCQRRIIEIPHRGIYTEARRCERVDYRIGAHGRLVLAVAEHGDVAALRHRKNIIFIFEQHHALARDFKLRLIEHAHRFLMVFGFYFVISVALAHKVGSRGGICLLHRRNCRKQRGEHGYAGGNRKCFTQIFLCLTVVHVGTSFMPVRGTRPR